MVGWRTDAIKGLIRWVLFCVHSVCVRYICPWYDEGQHYVFSGILCVALYVHDTQSSLISVRSEVQFPPGPWSRGKRGSD